MTKKTKTYSVKSPAKINVGLQILSKRKDGYHNIETIFYPLGKLFDEINVSIKPAKQTKISVKVTGNYRNKALDDSRNICYRAAKLFLYKFNIIDGCKIGISINKRIPIGAGLGGGSSNAAAVLKVLSKHFKIGKPLRSIRLRDIALELGSDVPFFLYGRPAIGSGRGEKLTPLPAFKINYKILIVNPGIHISTKWAYNKLRIRSAELRKRNQLMGIKRFNLSECGMYKNDFEKVAFRKYPVIEKIKNKMYDNGAVFASMSGSGSTVYGFFTKGKIKAAKKYFSGFSYKIFIS